MPVEIRALQASDQGAWRDLWTEYLTFYGSTVSDEVYETTFRRLISGADNEFNARLAILDGVAVGLVHFLYHRHCWRTQNVCYLQDLYAAPSVRGLGVGRALIEAVYADADAANAPNVYWLTQEGNAPARVLYDRIADKTDFIKYQRRAS